MQVTDYVKPELLVVAVVLYFFGHRTEKERCDKREICAVYYRRSGHRHLRAVCVCHHSVHLPERGGNGGIYGNHAGNPAGGSEYLYQGDDRTDKAEIEKIV